MAGWIGLGILAAVIVVPWALTIRRQWLRGGGGAGPMLRERQRLIDHRFGKPGFRELETLRSVREHRRRRAPD
jgi:hypothetical protein